MDFVFDFPSLQHLAMVKIVTVSWNQRDVWRMVSEDAPGVSNGRYHDWSPYRPYNSSRTDWLDKEKDLFDKISALPLPEPLRQLLAKLVEPLGSEMAGWYAYYLTLGRDFASLVDPSKPLRWTAWGTVDDKRMAELYARDEGLDVEKRYQLACFNCLEEDVRRLFQRLPENTRRRLIDDSRRRLGHGVAVDNVDLWTGVVNDEDNIIISRIRANLSIRQLALVRAAASCNRAACLYLFEKLSPEEIDQVLFKCADDALVRIYRAQSNYFAERLLPYFWLRLNDEREDRMLEKIDVIEGLDALLRWPWQPFFTERAKRVLRFADVETFPMVSGFIATRVLRRSKDYDYARLLREFWQLRPAKQRIAFLDDTKLLKPFLECGGKESVRFVANEASALQIERLLDCKDPVVTKMLLEEGVVSEQMRGRYERRVQALVWVIDEPALRETNSYWLWRTLRGIWHYFG